MATRFGSMLRTLRARRDKTQAQCARSIGVVELTWARWENGRTVPSLKNLKRIAVIFQIPLAKLSEAIDDQDWSDRVASEGTV